MTKHTPGPWRSAQALIDDNDCVIESATNQRMICECYEDGETQNDEDRANAKLIAAAPDLVEAAQAAWNCIAELSPTQARVESAQMLQSAITKATA